MVEYYKFDSEALGSITRILPYQKAVYQTDNITMGCTISASMITVGCLDASRSFQKFRSGVDADGLCP